MNVETKFTVVGTPASQGSKRHVGNGVMIESSKRLAGWRELVHAAARNALPTTGWEMYVDAVAVYATWSFRRPKHHYRTGKYADLLRDGVPEYVGRKPDIDKLWRALLDPITEAGVWRDDSLVAVTHGRKTFAELGEDIGVDVQILPLVRPLCPVCAERTVLVGVDRCLICLPEPDRQNAVMA